MIRSGRTIVGREAAELLIRARAVPPGWHEHAELLVRKGSILISRRVVPDRIRENPAAWVRNRDSVGVVLGWGVGRDLRIRRGGKHWERRHCPAFQDIQHNWMKG